MEVTREDLNPCTVRLVVTCDPEQVDQGFSKAYRTLGKRVRVPGFRPGTAPRAMIKQLVPKDELYQEAADEIIKISLKQALDQEKVTPDDVPAVEITEFNEEPGACKYTSKVPLKPIVELGDYKSLTAQRPPLDISEEQVDAQLEEMRRRTGKREAVTDRGVQDGDIAVVNIKLDGEEGDGRNFMTIAGKTFPELDEALRAMQVEEMKHLELQFPANFQEKDWAGKKLKCQVTLRSLNSVKLPELDDEFAQSLKTENLADLRVKLKERMQAAQRNMAQEYVNEQLLEELMRRSKVQVPDTMWEMVAFQRLRDLEADVRARGKTMEQFAQDSGMTEEQMREAWTAEAKTHVMRAVLAREIFTREELKLDNRDLNEALFEMAREHDIEPDAMFAALKKNRGLRELEFRAIFRKVVVLLNEHAKIEEAT